MKKRRGLKIVLSILLFRSFGDEEDVSKEIENYERVVFWKLSKESVSRREWLTDFMLLISYVR